MPMNLTILVVKTDENGRNILLKDVATLRDRFAESPNATYFNGNLSVQIHVSNTNEEDLISTAEAVTKYVEDLQRESTTISILNVVRDSSITLVQRTALLRENAIVGNVTSLVFPYCVFKCTFRLLGSCWSTCCLCRHVYFCSRIRCNHQCVFPFRNDYRHWNFGG